LHLGNDDGTDEGSLVFEMVFTNREDAKRVYEKGERACIQAPYMHWSMGMVIANDVEYAEHDIDNLVKEFLGEED
jgi:hypothetical protein